jgi:hypothetical protein
MYGNIAVIWMILRNGEHQSIIVDRNVLDPKISLGIRFANKAEVDLTPLNPTFLLVRSEVIKIETAFWVSRHKLPNPISDEGRSGRSHVANPKGSDALQRGLNTGTNLLLFGKQTPTRF